MQNHIFSNICTLLFIKVPTAVQFMFESKTLNSDCICSLHDEAGQDRIRVDGTFKVVVVVVPPHPCRTEFTITCLLQ